VVPVPKNIYGATKLAAEDLCQLVHREHGLPVLVLRTSRFFPEADDSESARAALDDLNLKTLELLYRRVDLHDVVQAHALALARATDIGFGKFIISATSPFALEDCTALRKQAAEVLHRRVPGFDAVFAALGWKALEGIDRVYVNAHARALLGWQPEYSFERALHDLAAGRDPRSELARSIGTLGYHPQRAGAIYPFVDSPAEPCTS
jgi:UDP-glucose 4-epimerase